MRCTVFICLALLLFSCRKESFTTSADARLTFSADTLRFDTVFTTTGSVTQGFKIFNDNNKSIRIQSVQVKGGAASPFKINVNGLPGPQVGGLEVAANDSAYVFVSVSINPTTANQPFVVRDSIEVAYNGNKEIIQLEAYGQNAHFLRNKKITGNEVWENDLPYVILGNLEVASGARLTIKEGCRIYINALAPFVVNGTLKVEGKPYDSTRVVFSGNRLDKPHKDYPASWPGLVFGATSADNEVRYAVIKNAYQAVVVLEPATTSNSKLTLTETIIDNAYDAGLLAINTSLEARNLLVSNCGKNVVLLQGGNYRFTHCTLASVATSYLPHKEPVLQVSNAALQNGVVVTGNLTASFRNCIFWGEGGEVEDEVVVMQKGNTLFSVLFDHTLWKVKTEPAPATILSPINEAPQFEQIDTEKKEYNFRLSEQSPALNKGTNTQVTMDLDGNPRPVGQPDLGAFEKQ